MAEKKTAPKRAPKKRSKKKDEPAVVSRATMIRHTGRGGRGR